MTAVANATRRPDPLGFFIPVAVLALWEVAARAHWAPESFSSPSLIFAQAWTMTASGELIWHLTKSLKLVGLGFVIGSTLGGLLGILSAVAPVIRSFWEPIVAFTYPVPKIVFMPLIFAWFGLADTSKIIIISASVFYPVFLAGFEGARSVKSVLIWAGLNAGANRLQIFWKVILPAALPHLFSGLRIGLALSFILMVTSELIVSNEGLGYLIARSETSLRFDIMFVAILTIGAAGLLADRLLIRLRDRLLYGQMLETEATPRG